MGKHKYRTGGEVRSQDWQDYDEENQLLYSYVKKKGKHQRAKRSPTNKKL
jgi:hypothetical protein|tara:strand:- start:2336 stop:2485 length:150 start_codon:yes stop_codon:yes gene_type:complete